MPDDVFYFRTMGVRPEYRKRGLGKAVVAKFVEIGLARGYRRFRLEVDRDNAPARRLFEGAGFEVFHESTCSGTHRRILSMSLEKIT